MLCNDARDNGASFPIGTMGHGTMGHGTIGHGTMGHETIGHGTMGQKRRPRIDGSTAVSRENKNLKLETVGPVCLFFAYFCK